MYSFDGLLAGGRVGGGAGAANKARSLFAPNEFLHGPATVPKHNVIASPTAATVMYFFRFGSVERFTFPGTFFFDIEFLFLAAATASDHCRLSSTRILPEPFSRGSSALPIKVPGV